MSAVLKPEGLTPPALSILQLEMQVNTTDRQLRSNLSNTKRLGLPELALSEPHERVLAIAGSGPSLRETWAHIPSDCDLLALNGAYRFLKEHGRTADYFAMLDARQVNVSFLQAPDRKTKFLLASQCHPDVFALLAEHQVEVFHIATPTAQAEFPEADLRIGGGGTIGLSALALALVLGYRKVILYGYDSSFDGAATHAIAQPQNAGLGEIDVWVQERQYRTTHAMAAQTMDFFPFYDAIKKVAPDFEINLIGRGLFYDYVATNNHPSTRERELSKYVEAYKHDDYGMTEERRQGLEEIISGLTGDFYLDVSTGRGETLALARKHGFSVVQGTETVSALCNEQVINAVLPDLPFLSKSFDVVSLIEVIEHLLPEDVVPALNELTRVAIKTIVISAAVQAHWYGGVNLHPSAQPEAAWDALFKEVWGDAVKRVRNLGSSPCWQVDL